MIDTRSGAIVRRQWTAVTRTAALGLLLALAACRAASPPPSADSEGRALIEKWITAINDGTGVEVMDRLLMPDYVWHLPGNDVRGRAAVKQLFVEMYRKCPHVQTIAEDVVVHGDRVIVRWTEICSPGAPPTSDITIDRVDRGRFVEGWEVDSDKAWVSQQGPSSSRASK